MSMTCEAFEAEAAELALGHIGEPQRAGLLDHAARCPRCRELLADLATVCDRMLDLAPEIEPPAGFEARALARMTPPASPESRSRLTLGRVAAAAAVALLLLVAGVAVGRISEEGGSGRGGSVATGAIIGNDGDRIGTAALRRGDPSRIVLTMDGPADWPGTWTCEVEAGGRWVEVGSWTADEVTNHVWAAGIDRSLDEITRMRILGRSGAVIGTAVLEQD